MLIYNIYYILFILIQIQFFTKNEESPSLKKEHKIEFYLLTIYNTYWTEHEKHNVQDWGEEVEEW